MSLLNFRDIAPRLCISGGYQDTEMALDFCRDYKIMSIIDLQFIDPKESSTARLFIEQECLEREIEYKAFFMRDDEYNQDLDGLLETVYNHLKGELERLPRQHHVLVKCSTGISRSATVLIYYLCKERKYTYSQALNFIRNAEQGQTEFGASPHPYFAMYLKAMFPDEWEEE